MSQELWENDTIQFPRLIAEIDAIGLTDGQIEGLCESMDLEREELFSLLARAQHNWENIKAQ
jgi:hypothetical protein